MRIKSRKTALIISLLLLGMAMSVKAAVLSTTYPDDSVWENIHQSKSYPSAVVDVQILKDEHVVQIKNVRMFYGSSARTPEQLMERQKSMKWNNPCTTPIDVTHEKYGKTTIQFHTKDGKPGKTKVYPAEDFTYELNLCLPKTKRTVRVTEYKYDRPDKLLRNIDAVYYDACGNAIFKTSREFNYADSYGQSTDKNCIGINDDGSLLILISSLEHNYLNNGSVRKWKSRSYGFIALVKYDGETIANSSLSPYTTADAGYSFSPGNKYTCVVANYDMILSRIRPKPPTAIFCADLALGFTHYIPVGGNVWDLAVNDEGEVTAKYMDKSDKNLVPGQIYKIHLNLNDLPWRLNKKK